MQAQDVSRRLYSNWLFKINFIELAASSYPQQDALKFLVVKKGTTFVSFCLFLGW